MVLKLRNNVGHTHDRRMMSGRIPSNRSLETLEEKRLIVGIKPREDLHQPVFGRKKLADKILHLQRLTALTTLSQCNRMR